MTTTADRRGPRPAPPQPRPAQPRLFALHRAIDTHGISGTGVVAWGIQWADGACALRWTGTRHTSTALYDSAAAVQAIHGHGDRTQIVWLDGNAVPDLDDVVTARAAWQRYRGADRTQYAHLRAAEDLAAMLPALCDGYEALALAYGQALAQLDQLRAEAESMQDALDTIAAVTDTTGGTAT